MYIQNLCRMCGLLKQASKRIGIHGWDLGGFRRWGLENEFWINVKWRTRWTLSWTVGVDLKGNDSFSKSKTLLYTSWLKPMYVFLNTSSLPNNTLNPLSSLFNLLTIFASMVHYPFYNSSTSPLSLSLPFSFPHHSTPHPLNLTKLLFNLSTNYHSLAINQWISNVRIRLRGFSKGVFGFMNWEADV